ncbi:hypothetical protein [uncultured Desulfosarcina sp.]|uniref:hypothetical protein n=1 Tax=uncultured Desulfosarcina sp. TaxID=218289 RepID=UPI0029C87FF0|nr:hypothetical protein [uncultured Desulfosarcina sp.]
MKANAKNLFDALIYFPAFKTGLAIGAFSARMGWDSFTRHFMRLNAKLALFIRNAETKQDITDAGREWKRMFPTSGMQKIVSSDVDTVFAETHVWCPLRDSGDVQACYKVMEFDRCLLEKIGGQFVVLESQAEHGVKACRVAIRSLGKPVDDLIPAHVRNQAPPCDIG